MLLDKLAREAFELSYIFSQCDRERFCEGGHNFRVRLTAENIVISNMLAKRVKS